MRSYLNDCMKIEQVMGEVYRKLAEVRIYSDRLRSIFERMARDEDDHARQLEMARGVPEEVFFEGARLEPERLETLLRRVHQLLRLADNPPRSESLMLETAKDIEREFLEVHLLNTVKFRDAEMVALFQDLAREDRKHLATLDDYYETKKSSRHSWH
jgi:rubrerythrin